MDKVINNRFLIHEKIGEGGFGSVYLAYDKETADVCALKVVRTELASFGDVQEAFAKEALAWMALGKHPNIVTLRSVDKFNGALHVTLEFIAPNDRGVNSIDKQLRVATPTLPTTLKWALDICEGMSHARKHGLVAHRDLKPSNLMIDVNGNIKVSDFGLAVVCTDLASHIVANSVSGTPAYMSPEQFVPGAEIGERSDIYSFGIVLYQLVTGGQLPYNVPRPETEDKFAYFQQLHQSYELPRFDSPLHPVIARCLAKRATERWSSFAAIASELEALFRNATGRRYRRVPLEEADAARHVNISASYMILGEMERALEHIDRAIHEAPSYMQAHNNRATILSELGRTAEAARIWKDLTRRAPELGRPHYNLGHQAMMVGDLPAAIQRFNAALELEPEYVPAWVNLAICHQNMRNYDLALQLYDRALECDRNDADTIYNKAYLLYELGRYADAKRLFATVVTLNPWHVSALNYLGLCHGAMNQSDTALEYFEKALAIDHTYVYAVRNRQLVLEEIASGKRKSDRG